MSMLKIISENKTTGYQIIKKVTELTGEKPSTGSIYPLLKSMQTKGWIKGTIQKGKTSYEITTSGLLVIQAHGSLKSYYEQKLNGSISLIHETFNDQTALAVLSIFKIAMFLLAMRAIKRVKMV